MTHPFIRLVLSSFLFSVLFLLSTACAFATTIYSAPGTAGSGLSLADPADLYAAVTFLSNDGDTIILDDGVYEPTNVLYIQDNVRIIGNSVDVFIDCAFMPLGSPYCLVFGDPIDPLTPNAGLYHVTMMQSVFNWVPQAITIRHDSSITIQDVTFENSIPYGIYLESSNRNGLPRIRNCTFEGAVAGKSIKGEDGAGFEYVKNSTFTAQGIDLVNSEAPNEISNNVFSNMTTGIALEIDDTGIYATGSIYNNEFISNYYGIEILTNNIGSISRNVIRSNQFIGNSFGIVLEGESEETDIMGNTFQNQDTGIFSIKGEHLIANNLLIETDYGIVSDNGNNSIAYNTIYDSSQSNYGIKLMLADQSLVVNNVIYMDGPHGIYVGNTSPNVQVGFNNAYITDLAGSAFEGPYTDLGGNISADPLFANPTNFHLQPGSPSINAADSSLFFISQDLDGNIRDFATPDMGCYES
jgi:hypothetical protein